MVDVVIPAYRPDEDLIAIIEALRDQTVKPAKIIIINTESKYLDSLIGKYPDVFKGSDGSSSGESVCLDIVNITKPEFDHGNTRNMGVARSEADTVVLMTQDAVPADERFIEELIAPLKTEGVAASYARQLPKADADITEILTREFNYPDETIIKSIEDMDKYGIKTFFCSNVSCAYDRRVFDEMGGFIKRTIFNEDMIYAANAMKAGYKICYAGKARVYHSHNLNGRQQFRRNVDLGVSQAEHPEIFANVKSESEGKKLVSVIVKELMKRGKLITVVHFGFVCFCRLLGYKIGKNYKKLPLWFVKKCSMSPGYFS